MPKNSLIEDFCLTPCLDLVTLLRKQLADKPPKFATAEALPAYQNFVTAAAA